MKKLIILLLAVFLISSVSETYATTFGVKGGLNLSNMFMKDNSGTYSTEFEMLPGFQIGATAEFDINEKYAFETGLLFATKGYKFEHSVAGEEYSSTLTLNYIDIPLAGKGYFNVQNFDVYGLLGAYIGYGIGGTASSDYDEQEDEDISFGSEQGDDFKPFDFGLLIGAGVQYQKFEFGLSYALGLANLSVYDDDDMKVNNRVISVTVGYKFN